MRSQEVKRVWHWMNNDLSILRPELNNLAICPWIRKYKDRIGVVEVEGLKTPIKNSLDMLKPVGLIASVLIFPKDTSIWKIRRAADQLLELEHYDWAELLINDPSAQGLYRGLYTGYRHRPLVIVQDHHILKSARYTLRKNGYYNSAQA
tara:strand:+ start:1501 stop:1947 length:447 start_codon:yes stop_codon:yes gene_type:complete